ncbi:MULTISPECIES: DUF6325 family protein [unclassified Streptomyces]|uniref:DUF6325 family protein n=1 Tax=unclassified Streptomyces TaxID=2593676 RepID=UPI002DDC5580|nr:DUF6325 family protein [Streptomyces sp. NBC_01750]WSA99321.1 DUF6325 family protein [Streptomyces sp. NBC_01794]WSD36113.1 DUF6325 family protein [Streptomyces sp. NBC_01750]
MSDDIEEMGPVDYLVVEFPGNRMTGEGFPLLVDLVDRGIIRILDLVFVRKDSDGSVSALELKEFGDELDLTVFEGASSGLLGQDDLDEAGTALEPGSSAGILVYENLWAAPFARAMRRSGAQLVTSGRIPVQALLASLDAVEASGPDGPIAD